MTAGRELELNTPEAYFSHDLWAALFRSFLFQFQETNNMGLFPRTELELSFDFLIEFMVHYLLLDYYSHISSLHTQIHDSLKHHVLCHVLLEQCELS